MGLTSPSSMVPRMSCLTHPHFLLSGGPVRTGGTRSSGVEKTAHFAPTEQEVYIYFKPGNPGSGTTGIEGAERGERNPDASPDTDCCAVLCGGGKHLSPGTRKGG